jgi:hypothetical protein
MIQSLTLNLSTPQHPILTINGENFLDANSTVQVEFRVGDCDGVDANGKPIVNGGQDIPIPITQYTATQINVLVPPTFALGTASISVICTVTTTARADNSTTFLTTNYQSPFTQFPVSGLYSFSTEPGKHAVAVIDNRAQIPGPGGTLIPNPNLNSIIAQIPVTGTNGEAVTPEYLAVTPDHSRVYVTTQEGGIFVLDAVTFQEINTDNASVHQAIYIPLGNQHPNQITIDDAGNYAYVTDSVYPTIYVVDINPYSNTYNTIVKQIAVKNAPEGLDGLAINADDTRLFVAAPNTRSITFITRILGAGNSNILDIDLTTDPTTGLPAWNQIASIPADQGTYGVTRTSDPNVMLFTDYLSDDTALGVITNAESSPTVNYGSLVVPYYNAGTSTFALHNASSVAVTPDGKFAFVTGFNEPNVDLPSCNAGVPNNEPAGSNVGIFEFLDTNGPYTNPILVAATRAIPEGFPLQLAVSPDGTYLYVDFKNAYTTVGQGAMFIYNIPAMIATILSMQSPNNLQPYLLQRNGIDDIVGGAYVPADATLAAHQPEIAIDTQAAYADISIATGDFAFEVYNSGHAPLAMGGGAQGIAVEGYPLSVVDASGDDSPETVLDDGALNVSYDFSSAAGTVTNVAVNLMENGTVIATLATPQGSAILSNYLLDLDPLSAQLIPGDYLVQAVATIKTTSGTSKITSVMQPLTVLDADTEYGGYSPQTFKFTPTPGQAMVYYGGGGTNTLDLSSLSSNSQIVSIDGQSLSAFQTGANSIVSQAIYHGTAFDYIRLADGEEIYFQGIDDIILPAPAFALGPISLGHQVLCLVPKPTNAYYSNQWNLAVTNVPDAWRFTTGSGSILLVSLDSGLQTQPETNNDGLSATRVNAVTGVQQTSSTDASGLNNHGNESVSIMAATPAGVLPEPSGPGGIGELGPAGAPIGTAASSAGGIAGINWTSPVLVENSQTSDNIATDIQSALTTARLDGQQVVFQCGLGGEPMLGQTTIPVTNVAADGSSTTTYVAGYGNLALEGQLMSTVQNNENDALFAVAAGNEDINLSVVPKLTLIVTTSTGGNAYQFTEVQQNLDILNDVISQTDTVLTITNANGSKTSYFNPSGPFPANVLLNTDSSGNPVYVKGHVPIFTLAGQTPGDGSQTEFINNTTTPSTITYTWVDRNDYPQYSTTNSLSYEVGNFARLLSQYPNFIAVGALEHGETIKPIAPFLPYPYTVPASGSTTADEQGLDNAKSVNLAPYSNYGALVPLVAPTDSPAIDGSGNVEFPFFNGTSAANPNMAGIASLVWSADPNLTGNQVATILADTAIQLLVGGSSNTGSSNSNLTYGYGLVDASAAVRRAYALAQNPQLAGLFADNGYDYASGATAPAGPLPAPLATSGTGAPLGTFAYGPLSESFANLAQSDPPAATSSAPAAGSGASSSSASSAGSSSAAATASGTGGSQGSVTTSSTAAWLTPVALGVAGGSAANLPVFGPLVDPPTGLTNPGFDEGSNGLGAWTVSNSSFVTAIGQNEVLMQEDATDVKTDLSQDFVVAQDMSVITFTIDATTFDGDFQNGETPDAFGASLLDSVTGKSLVPTVDGSTDSFYTQDLESGITSGLAADGVMVSAGATAGTICVSVDTSALGGDNAELLFRVIAGSDPETQASVTLSINQAAATTATVTSAPLAYGTALENSQLSGTATAVVDGQSVTVPGTFAYTTAAGDLLDAGNGQTEWVAFTPSDTNDYDIAITQVTVNVAPATPTVSVSSPSIIYGTALADNQLAGTATWVVNGQSVAVDGVFTYTTAAGARLQAGDDQSEAVTFTPTDSTDYNSVQTTAVVNVAKAALTVTAESQSTTYGDSVPALIYSYTGLVNGDASASFTGALTTSATSASPVGNYGISENTLAATGNYTIGTFSAGSLKVNAAPLTVTAVNQDMTYGGGVPALTYTYAGLVNNDKSATFTGALTTSATSGSPVASYPISENTLAATGNYTIGTFNPGSLKVNAALLTVTAVNQSMTYGGSLPALTYTYTGLVNGDKIATFAGALTTSATTASPAGAYGITEGTLAATGNYTIGTFNAGSLKVNAALLTVTAVNQSMTYGGSLPALTYTYTGLVNNDKSATFTGALTTSATSGSPVGSYPIGENTLAATGNYRIGTFSAGSLKVNAALLTVTAVNQSMTYGGSVPALTYTYTGLVNGDKSETFTGALTTPATSGSSVATYAINEGTLAATGNYSIGMYHAGSLKVNAAPLTVTANNATKVVGTPNPSFSVAYAGFVNGASASSLVGTLVITTTATTNSPAGTYPITPGGLTSSNYAITFVPGTLTVTALNFSIYVLDPTAAGAFSLSGDAFVNTTGNIVVDSKAANAISASGNSGIMAASVQVVGGVSTSGNAHVTKTGAPTSTADPLAGLVAPAVPSYAASPPVSLAGNSTKTISPGLYSQISLSGNAQLTLNPGVYVIGAGGITVSGNASLVSNSSPAGMGVTYILQGGGVTVSGNASLKAANALIYDAASGSASGSINLSGNGTFSLSPPSTGPDAGVVILQPAGNTKALSLSGNALAGTAGTIYAPKAQLVLSGNGQIAATLVVDTLSISGNVVVQPTSSGGSAVLVPDPLCPSQTMLSIVGTSLNDVIRVNAGANAGDVTVIVNNQNLGTFHPTGRIVVHGLAGNDTISVAQNVLSPAWLYGDDGNDQLQGGGGPTLLMGGAGNNTLWGGNGPTIMIGGSGSNSLIAGAGNAALIGGSTAYDANDSALLFLLNTWSSAASYLAGVPQIMNLASPYSFNAKTVLDDQAVDNLFGGSGMDLFFDYPDDNLQQRRSNETVMKL